MLVVLLVVPAFLAVPARAWVDLKRLPGEDRDETRGVHVLDGAYVMNVGELQVNITNHGLIGSRHSELSSYSEAPSGQWPAGSGDEYLWGAGLWVGAVMDAMKCVSTGQFEREFRPLEFVRDTIYEARDGRVVRPADNPGMHGLRVPQTASDDDGDGFVDEETLNGYDDDGDGLIDEDFGQIGQQMMVCTMYDNTPLAKEIYPDHVPMGLRVEQTSFTWDAPEFRNFVGFRFTITNVGNATLRDVYTGFLVDCDIGSRQRYASAMDDMAGFYEGTVRASDGTYAPVTVGYMYDGAEVDPLPGYFGLTFLGSRSAVTSRIRTFRVFAGQQAYESGGDPINDEQRYTTMSNRRQDADTKPGEENDYRFLMSVGPWPVLPPGGQITFDVALVVGDGLDGMLQSCADALSAWRGRYCDLDGDRFTGMNGHETQLCFSGIPGRGSSLYEQTADFMDESCVGNRIEGHPIVPTDLVRQPDGRYCIWVNMDNCEECDRIAGARCTNQNRLFEWYWHCNEEAFFSPPELYGCTGVYGAEARVPWIVERFPPPPPALRVVPGSNEVHLFWRDDSEHAVDPQWGVLDFESYRIWRADDWNRPPGTSIANGPASDSWKLIAEYDVRSFSVEDRILNSGQAALDTVQLGANTGLEVIAYRPACLDNALFQGLAQAMQDVLARDSHGKYEMRPLLRNADMSPVPGLEGLLPWENYPTVLDTFFMVAARPANPAAGVVGKRGSRFYEHIDRAVHNGFLYFYSVSTTDHAIAWRSYGQVVAGPGLAGSPSSSFTSVVPGTRAQSVEDNRRSGVDIFVYPNPATRASLAQFQPFHPNSDDPTGERIMFANLPQCVSRISIFTEDGDLVKELRHDGGSGVGEVSWNLVSRSGQEIVSGIYLYTVRPDDRRFKPFTGKFVVIK